MARKRERERERISTVSFFASNVTIQHGYYEYLGAQSILAYRRLSMSYRCVGVFISYKSCATTRIIADRQ